jgi:hypothetical protein
MARTSLTVVKTAAYGAGVADVGFEAVDQPNGNVVDNRSGRLRLLIANASAGTVTCTVKTKAGPLSVGEVVSKTLTVAAAKTGFMGPFDPSIYEQADGTVLVDWDVGTSITVAAVDSTA